MWNRTVILALCLLLIKCLESIRAEPGPLNNECFENTLSLDYSSAFYKMCVLLDREVDPCDNFYRFACGKYDADKSQSDSSDSSTKLLHEHHSKNELMKYFNAHDHWDDANKNGIVMNLAKVLYKSCLNRGKLGLKPMVQLIERNGGWPVLWGESGKETRTVHLSQTARIIYEGLDMKPILFISKRCVTIGQKKSSEIYLEQPTFFYKKGLLMYYKDIYLKFMVDVAVQFGANRNFAAIEMNKVLLFEIELAESYVQPFEETIWLTIDSMRMNYPTLRRYILPILYSQPNVTVDGNKKIYLYPTVYFDKLEILLKKTSNATIANYLIWRAVLAASLYLTEELHQRIEIGFAELNNEDNPSSSYKITENQCFNHVDELLPTAIDSMYITLHGWVLNNKRQTIKNIMTNINKEFSKLISDCKWMDNRTKVDALSKLASLDFAIGGSEFDLQEEMKNLLNFKLELHSENFLENYLLIRKHLQRYPIKRLPVWKTNAKYNHMQNAIYLPVATLSWPYSSLETPPYLNYGSLGSVIGHEIGHAFLMLLRGISRISFRNTWGKHLKIGKCFREQYSGMKTETGIKLNGLQTMFEDMCDHVGVKASYGAYRKLPEVNEELPGLFNYTHRQMFWIARAQPYCGFINPKNYEKRIYDDIHTLNPYRIMGTMKNMREFTEDFQCPPSSAMYFDTHESCEYF